MRLLPSIANASNHTKCVSLSNLKCMAELSPINLNPNEYSQELHHYPFAIKLYVLDLVTVLVTYLIKYVFQTKQHVQHDYRNK